MSKEIFRGKLVSGLVDPDLYWFWILVHTLQDAMGDECAVLRLPGLARSWLDFCNAIDDAFARSFPDEGVSFDWEVVFYSRAD